MPNQVVLRRGETQETALIAVSPPMRALFESLQLYAAEPDPILLTGESGVGKTVLALEAHCRSRFAEGPFVPVNCAGVAESLFEAELFGHSAGAFTGARRASPGFVGAADRGTLYLDELGELPPNLQPKLLMVLDTGHYYRVGEPEHPRQLSCRVVAATNQDLPTLIRAGRFRSDLYYRLSTFEIQIPPLRERREDISAFVQWFLSQPGLEECSISDAAMQQLLSYSWPGNVRELYNVLRRAVVLAKRGLVEEKHIRLNDARPTQEIGPRPPFGEDIVTWAALKQLEETVRVMVVRRVLGAARSQEAAAGHLEVSSKIVSRYKGAQPHPDREVLGGEIARNLQRWSEIQAWEIEARTKLVEYTLQIHKTGARAARALGVHLTTLRAYLPKEEGGRR